MAFDVINGSGAPSNGVGANGDFYLDNIAFKMYGPKASGAWPAGVSMVGPQGPAGDQGTPGTDGTDGTNGSDGADGLSVLHGTSVPDGSVGVDGDFYIRTSTSFIYGPRIGGAWGSGISLIGPQGPAGTNGTNGSTGAKGDPGDPGTNPRTVVNHTETITANANATGVITALGKSFALLKVVSSALVRIRLYATAAQRDADVSRPSTTPPAAGTQHGVICDLVLDTTPKKTWILSPVAYGANMESSVSADIPYSITNLDATGSISIDFTRVGMES